MDPRVASASEEEAAYGGVAELFAVDHIGDATWRSRRCDPKGGRMYGGTLLAQLLTAARATLTSTVRTNSLDVRFLRPADGGRPVDYQVETVHDGASSALRRISVTQDDLTVAVGTVGFHRPRVGWTHGTWPTAVHPDSMPPTGTPHRSRAVTDEDFDIRFVDDRTDGRLVRQLWFRTVSQQPSDIGVHEAALLFVSDIYFFEPLCLEHGHSGSDRTLRYATTQHSVWFHRAPKVDHWLLIESLSPVQSGGRGLVRGEIRSTDQQPVATVIQEAVTWVVDSAERH
ncbi:thioesterase family protein [Mycobacterium sp. Aquia_216]|uniref:acyl-CoA thioesterase n=1 Tax=Mycobacterium sp. Aquia_216 TaxID=2991729 RepID=UPI00227B0F72|nr:acyl-CoA thioesterase domain-containing protein [Mycobacterium sp. Aquia_216]WAJ45344.1 thioesterase family protein [Mycobacterium sp. Aquia_216]